MTKTERDALRERYKITPDMLPELYRLNLSSNGTARKKFYKFGMTDKRFYKLAELMLKRMSADKGFNIRIREKTGLCDCARRVVMNLSKEDFAEMSINTLFPWTLTTLTNDLLGVLREVYSKTYGEKVTNSFFWFGFEYKKTSQFREEDFELFYELRINFLKAIVEKYAD